MDLPAEKFELMEWLISLEDKTVIKKLQKIKEENTDSGASYEISDTEKLFLRAGLKDLKEGNTYSHEDVMREVKEKYGI